MLSTATGAANLFSKLVKQQRYLCRDTSGAFFPFYSVLSLVFFVKSSMKAWLERSAQANFAAALASLLSTSSILPFLGFFLPHSYVLQSAHFHKMAFCVELTFRFSPFSVSLVKWNLTLIEGGSLFLCLCIIQKRRQAVGLRGAAVWSPSPCHRHGAWLQCQLSSMFHPSALPLLPSIAITRL